ncbi:MAG: slipin family protein [Candidatus Omnitrophica bacterium]|nr:slipin family protein [Candidatus Omnitrophota bacterium]
MMGAHPLPVLLFLVSVIAGLWACGVSGNAWAVAVGTGIGLLLGVSIKVGKQWQKAVVLRLGKFYQLKGPGIFVVLPFIDTVPYWIDVRTITTPFTAEQTLTKDSIPVDVDAVLFWRVIDSMKAALEVENYREAIAWASQTALRDVIGKTDLSEMLVGREKIDALLCEMIDHRSEPWGIKAHSVEIRDVKIPPALQNAMSMQAQAERERQARIILGDSERQVAMSFAEASRSYVENPTALHLRAMNILLEGMRQSSTVIIVPSTAVETMGLGAAAGLTALAKEALKESPKPPAPSA